MACPLRRTPSTSRLLKAKEPRPRYWKHSALLAAISMIRLVLIFACQADPTTPFVSAQAAAKLLGSHATLVEQLGVGHVSVAQFSSCTLGIIANYVLTSKVGSRFS